jgi:hypothetical protein
MARERRRVLIPPARLREVGAQGCLTLSPEHSRYLRKVLRYTPGDRFAVVDGAGHLWDAELLDQSQARLLQPLEQPLLRESPPSPALVLLAAVVKRDFELVVRMAVELGVDRLVPITSERTAVLGQLRSERWQTIAEEAAEQCERLWLPHLDPPTPLAQLLRWELPDRKACRGSPPRSRTRPRGRANLFRSCGWPAGLRVAGALRKKIRPVKQGGSPFNWVPRSCAVPQLVWPGLLCSASGAVLAVEHDPVVANYFLPNRPPAMLRKPAKLAPPRRRRIGNAPPAVTHSGAKVERVGASAAGAAALTATAFNGDSVLA